jgi:transposase-like protein
LWTLSPGVKIGCKSPQKRGPYSMLIHIRDVEDLLAERGIMVSYETVRRWVNHFEPMVAADLRKRPKPHTTWHLDEVYDAQAAEEIWLCPR